jgi:DNA-binding XRE family transcriptional regulator
MKQRTIRGSRFLQSSNLAAPHDKKNKGHKEVTPLDFGQNARMERLRQYKTQADIAQSMGAQVPRITQIENGHHDLSLSTINRFAAALNVPVAQLMQPHNAEIGG